MPNMVVLVGKLTYIYEADGMIEVTTIKPIYEDDKMVGEETTRNPVLVGSSMMKHIKDYCHIGDTIGIKGSTKNRDNSLVILGEKLTFLSSQAASPKGGETDDSE